MILFRDRFKQFLSLQLTSWFQRRRPAEHPCVSLVLSISVQLAAPAILLGSCVNSNENLMIFVHFYDSCTRILSIKTGNAHQQRMLPQTLIDILKRVMGRD